MSRSLRYLSNSLRPLTCVPTGSGLAPPRGARRYVQAAFKTRTDHEPTSAPQRTPHRRSRTVYADDEDFDLEDVSGSGSDSRRTVHREQFGLKNEEATVPARKEPEPYFAEHLNGLFPTLQFPPELSRRILTHGSHPAAVHGHNAGLSFMGRRVLESYLLLMLSSSPSLRPKHDLEDIVSRTLNTYLIGEHVGSPWGLGRVLRWTPTISASKLRSGEPQEALLKNVGLYKVQGDAVAAVMGGIFHQFGGSVSHRVFHTRVLPKLLLWGKVDGLPDLFHAEAQAICERMGGVDGSLLATGLDTQSIPSGLMGNTPLASTVTAS